MAEFNDELSRLCSCPFCGSDLVGIEREKDFPPKFYVMCHQCFSRGGYDDTVSKAVNNWNTRANSKSADFSTLLTTLNGLIAKINESQIKEGLAPEGENTQIPDWLWEAAVNEALK